jgi:hypothetical protein
VEVAFRSVGVAACRKASFSLRRECVTEGGDRSADDKKETSLEWAWIFPDSSMYFSVDSPIESDYHYSWAEIENHSQNRSILPQYTMKDVES